MTQNFISKRYTNLPAAQGIPVDKINRYPDVINLTVGDPDLYTPPVVTQKAFEDAKNGYTKYTEVGGYPELREEIRKYYKDDLGLEIADNELMVVASGLLGMYITLQATIDEGDEVLIQSPAFWPYFDQVRMAGGNPIEMPTYEEEDFQINIERFESMITDKTKAVLIHSPSNPTGSCHSMDTMKSIAKIAQKYDLLVISDEIYTAYSFQEKFVPFSSLPGMKERTITINSFSKNFLMTGWRIGNIVAPKHIIDVMKYVNINLIFCAPAPAQRGAIHALRHRHEVQPQIIEEYRGRMEYAAKRINEIPWMSTLEPKGSFYLFINIKKTGLTSKEAVEMILDKAHVLLFPGSMFGDCGEGYLRLCCTVGKEKLGEAFDRIAKIEL